MNRQRRLSAPGQGRSAWNRPQVRALVFQALFLGAVLAFLGFILHNTLNNLESRGISTGFAFLSNEAGFGIIQTLVDYSETSSFGRTFLVGLLNTLLVSALGIVLATVVGFLIGVARLSGNWLISRLAAAYIETFRNIPLLLQIFFWYFAVLRALPHPRDSLAVGEGVFLNLRGLYLPRPVFEQGFALVVAAEKSHGATLPRTSVSPFSGLAEAVCGWAEPWFLLGETPSVRPREYRSG